MRLLLIRHAEGMHDRYKNLGNESSGLTAVGWEQADTIAVWLQGHERVDVLISDGLLQSRLTAQRIGQTLGIPVSVSRELPQRPREEWRLPGTGKEAPRRLALISQHSLQELAEPYAEFHQALIEGVDRVLENTWGKTVALVTGAESIATLLRHVFGAHQVELRLDHTSVSELVYAEGAWRINYINRLDHLPPPPVIALPAAEATPAANAEVENLTPIIHVYGRVSGADFERKGQDDRPRIRHLLNFAKLPSDLTILDVGTGLGILPLMLAEDGAKTVVGIDISADMLERAEYLRLSHPSATTNRVSYRLAPAQALPFRDGCFDVVTCRLVLNHTRKPEKLVREFVRVLRPGGILLLAELLSVDNPVKRATQNAIEERRNPSHTAARSAEQYNKLITDAGLVIEAKESISFERELEEWLAAYRTDKVDAAAVREMIEAGLEADAAGINARRAGNKIVFDQRMYYLKAVKPISVTGG